jgi:His-Xaa-Ser system protein HxsD
MDVQFDLNVFSAETVQRAALKYSDLCSFSFRLENDLLIVTIKSTVSGADLDLASFADRLRNEVLDQHLRSVIAAETEQERNLILAHAFSYTKLVSS